MRVEELVETVLNREEPVRLVGVRGSAGSFLTSSLREGHAGLLVVVTPTSSRAEEFARDLETWLDDGRVEVFPRYDTAPFDRFSPHPEVEARRMSLLYALLASEPKTPLTVVTPWSALLRRVLPREELRTRVTHLERGMTVDRDALVEVLVAAGYHRTSLVEERGELAARGAIIDLFPPHLEQPVRLEFEFEDIGSIRLFDPVTQRSAAELRNVVAIPPRAFRLPEDRDELLHRVRERGKALGLPESNIYQVTESLARRHSPPGIENLEMFFHDGMETVFDYLPGETLIIVDEPEQGRGQTRSYLEEIFDAHAAAGRQDRLVCDPLELYLGDETAWDAVEARRPVLLDSLGASDSGRPETCVSFRSTDHQKLRRDVQDRRGSGRALEPLVERIEGWTEAGRRVRLVSPSLSSAERLADILRDYGQELPIRRKWAPLPRPGAPEIGIATLHQGFDLPGEGLVVLTEEDVFGARRHARYARVTRRGESIEQLAQIQEGDYLVHAEHGIAQFGGLVQLLLGGVPQELLLLLYNGADKLYVPISRLDRIQRYTGADGSAPTLDRLSGQSWQRTKSRVRRAVQDMAKELLAIYAAREIMEGHRYPPPDADYEEFEAAFPYEDTPDQRRATEEVLANLQGDRPMDRLVCGDVGFGKTEIACRAAHRVASAGRQVAFLVPTTILCQQHYNTLRERFEGTPIEIESLSRLSTPAQARKTREGLASARVDIVVGTHRLLSKDIQFRNLGLVIVDEEHRFGVKHKERLKELRKLVDVLTLSATPIPRTLQMAFSGLRDLSLITTPPPDRMAVRTQICRLSDEVTRDAVRRELRRGGQSFFVHNRIETIEEFAEYVRGLVPEAKIGVAHGQMPEQSLERIMLSFMNREFDVLVCTAIIESGLDIPNANTILIHRADRFGLAQLYQLRGRVGRSDRRAYAYLFLPPEGTLTDDARRRIEAIQDLSELGAGYRLATHDLEIRGAGNLLGAEQSGHVADVGYDLYMEMLEDAIAELRGQGVEETVEPEIRLPLPALLPEVYVPDVNQRLVFYKQLSATRDYDEVAAIRSDLLDRFGPLPPETQNLLEVIRLKIRCRQLGIEEVETSGSELVLRVSERTRIDPTRLVELLQRPGCPIRATPDHRIRLSLRKSEDAVVESFGLLDLLAPEKRAESDPSPPLEESV
jgi:transcription-repair coupling factor (superfamily II helicase)